MEQLSQQVPSEELYQCQICCTNNTSPVLLLQPSLICYQCWHQHVKTSVTRITYKTGSELISPFEGKPPVDICIALNSLNNQHATQLEEWLFKKYSSFTIDIEKCPSENCQYVFTTQKCKWGSNSDQKCPSCDAQLLPSTSFNLKGLIGFIYFLLLTNKCPKCQIPIEKTTGCPHMSCPCGHQFCWFCLKDYFSTPTNVYSVHEPRQCAFIFLSKIIFMSICLAGVILTFLGNDIFHKFVSYFFVGLKYILLTIFIDLIIISNILVVNHIIQKVRNYRIYGFQNRPTNIKYMAGALVFVDLIILLFLYMLQLYTLIFWVLIVEGTIATMGSLTVWLVVYSVETWFDYIC